MILRACALALIMTGSAGAQTVSPGLEHANPEMNAAARQAVQQRVEDFLKKLGNRDVSGIRTLLAPKALIASARQQGSATGAPGTFANNYLTGEEFLAQLEKNAGQPKFEERIANVVVTVDSERLAYVRADFTIVRQGKTVSSGVNHFTLLKEAGGWQIAVLAYTALPAQP